MLNENAKKWVAALRSGKYKQTRERLRYGDEFCCLGVACEVAIENGVPVTVYRDNDFFRYDGMTGSLSSNVRSWLGLRTTDGDYGDGENKTDLTFQNDEVGKTFSQIADIIESEPEGLFLPEPKAHKAVEELETL